MQQKKWRMQGIVSCCILFALSGCAPVERQQARVRHWWAELTGTAADTLKTGKVVLDSGTEVVRHAGETLLEFEARVEKVKAGAEKIAEGKKLIQEGVGK